MRKLFKEPLVHFVLLGFLIFLIYGLKSGNQPVENEIIIDDNQVNHFVSLWKLRWQRDPTPIELQNLVDEYVEQEVLYREALRMNLDHDDEVVKRRLAQKMQFLSSDLSQLVNPATEENLRAFYHEYKNKYQTDYRYNFYHVLFTPTEHEKPQDYAKAILGKYDTAQLETIAELGDITSLPKSYSNAEQANLTLEIGGLFAETLVKLPLNQWSGPVPSVYGAHLVYITKRESPKSLEFEDVKDRVKLDFEYMMEKESEAEIIKELKSLYSINITSEQLKSD